jgi:hypothetical protein
MWYKLLLFCCAIAVMVFLLRSQDTDSVVSTSAGPVLTRRAENVLMLERSRETGRTLKIAARRVVESEDGLSRFLDFRLEQEDGPELSGTEASYDRSTSLLTISGELTIATLDGGRVVMNGLSWDRQGNTAHTDNPVRIEAASGVITAERASFSDGFTRIALTGRVHAKIMQNILGR